MLKELRLDEAIWNASGLLRRADLRTAIEELCEDRTFADEVAGEYGLVTMGTEAIVFEFLGEDGEVQTRLDLPHATLAPVVANYLAIIQKMGADDVGSNVTRLEALDMAKRVAHDAAARTVEGHLPGIARDLAGYRRLFTLLFSLHVDATTLTFARGHRFT